MSNECPDCGSSDTAKISVVYSTGTSAVNTVTTGVGVGSGGNVGAGVATTTGTTQSLQAKSIAPPKKPGNAGMGCAAYIALFLLFMFVLNPMLLDIGVIQNSTAHNVWSFGILLGGAVVIAMWMSALTKSQMPAWEAAMDA